MLQKAISIDNYNYATVFDLMAEIISVIPSGKLRAMVSSLGACTQARQEKDLAEYGQIYHMIQRSRTAGYYLSKDCFDKLIGQINQCLNYSDYMAIGHILELMDQAIGDFSHSLPYLGLMQSAWRPVVPVPPLNRNHERVQVKIYPTIRPFWSLNKAESTRALNINAVLSNYHAIFSSDERAAEIRYYYLRSDIVTRAIAKENGISIALSPVCNDAKLILKHDEINDTKKIRVMGLENKEHVNTRIKQIFKVVFDRGFHLIAFPEVIGSREVMQDIQCMMRKDPSRSSLVFLPTFYEDGYNKEIILGPGGYPIHEQHKIVAFQAGKTVPKSQEDIIAGECINILLIDGLGAVSTPICMDLLEANGSRILHDVVAANTIVCPSFSPGIQAFKDSLAKGQASHTLEIWLNTCSAHMQALFPSDYGFRDVGMIHLPEVPSDQTAHRLDCVRTCDGKCSDEICYFNISLQYKNNKFHIQSTHEIA